MRLLFKPMNLIIDSHEDLAWNIINLGRDYTRSAYDTRKAEVNTPIPAFNGNTLLGWPEYQSANVALVFGTLYCEPKRLDKGTYPLDSYSNPDEAHTFYRRELDAYLKLADEHPDKFRLIFSSKALQQHWQQWETHLANPGEISPPVGIVVLMEGAEGVREPAEVEKWG